MTRAASGMRSRDWFRTPSRTTENKFRRAGNGSARSRANVSTMSTAVPRGIPLRPDPTARDREQIRSLVRAITGIAFSSEDRSGDAYVTRAWPSDHLAATIARAAVAPATMASSGLPIVVAVDVLPSLAPKSAAVRLFAKSMHVSLDRKSEVIVPRGVADIAPIFVGEGGSMPVIKLSFTSSTIGPTRKILIGTAVTNELESAGPEVASDVIGRLLAEAATRSLDSFVFAKNADVCVRPPGLLHGLTAIGASSGTGSAGVAADLGAPGRKHQRQCHIDSDDMIIVANPRQAAQIRFLAGPGFDASRVFGTAMVPDKRVIGIAPSAVASAYAGIPSVEKKRDPAVVFQDTNPPNIGTPGSPAIVAQPTLSSFQNDMTAIRVRCNASWSVVAAGGVAYIDAVSW